MKQNLKNEVHLMDGSFVINLNIRVRVILIKRGTAAFDVVSEWLAVLAFAMVWPHASEEDLSQNDLREYPTW
jgi:hypothetical protein